MKINKFVASIVCVSAFFASCSNKTAEQNQIKYTHTSRVDGDAFHFFQVVASKVPYEVGYASHVNTVGASSKAKAVATEIEKVYGDLFPQLESIATEFYVEIPLRGAAKFVTDEGTVDAQDSTEVAPVVVFNEESYLKHTVEEQALVIEQFKRLSRNTNKKLRDFAVEKLPALEELYVSSGGVIEKEDHH